LCEHGFFRKDQNTLPLPPANQLAENHANLNGFTQAYLICKQQAWAHLLQRPVHCLLLIFHGGESTHIFKVWLRIRQWHLPELRFQKQAGSGIAFGFIPYYLSFSGINFFQLIQLREERSFMPTVKVVYTGAEHDLMLVVSCRINASYQPFCTSTLNSHARSKYCCH